MSNNKSIIETHYPTDRDSKQPDYILRSNTDEIWYSSEYLRKQIEHAYQAGISVGARIDFHAMIPTTDEAVENLHDEFWKKIDQTYQQKFAEGVVWNVAKKSLKP